MESDKIELLPPIRAGTAAIDARRKMAVSLSIENRVQPDSADKDEEETAAVHAHEVGPRQ
jgi:hypothetical protein